MEGRARCRVWQIIAATVLMCSLASCLIYFSLQRISKVGKQDEDIVEGNALEVKRGSIFFKEKELDYQSDSAAATENALTQPDHEVVDDMANAAWGLLNAKLQCGSNEFKFKATGPGAADIQLEMENGKRLPLIQVPKECGFSVKQTALGLLVTVSYDGCSVKQENGTYSLLMKWREDDVKITCTLLETPDKTLSTSESTHPLMPQRLHRSKRHLRWPPVFYPCSPHKRSRLCMFTPPPATTTTTTTTAEPKLPPLIHPYYIQKMLSLYPIYETYLNMPPEKVMHQLAGKNLGWKLLQMPEKRPQHFQILFEMLPRTTTTVPPTTIKTTPCTTTTTTSYGDNNCPGFWRRWVPFPKFSPRVSINGQDYLQFMGNGQDHLQFMGNGQDHLQFMRNENYRPGSQTRDVSESLWESFPLIPFP
ncbi:uncharacterized protein LOC119415124 isoform X2 [Nematolebias whitei]|uniref:uncharacterized protein LOC119415124 isoform X2 n=1 Tax=Nematolebias whitei TaxID=451745 RepID=UPI0018988CB1|nr:uncharacterized protein LOC119415124 isoform X2 [Nematolebias whitei]